MPRYDRTFSDIDVIRIFKKHLTKKERKRVILVICELDEDEGEYDEILEILKVLLDAVKTINDIIEPALKYLAAIPWLRPILIVLEITEIILNTVIELIQFFENLEREKKQKKHLLK